MTEEEFKKAMTKTVIFIVIMIILLIVIGILVFNKSGKSTTIFESEEQKSSYENTVNEINKSDISDEHVNQIEGDSQEFETDGSEDISSEDENVINQEEQITE